MAKPKNIPVKKAYLFFCVLKKRTKNKVPRSNKNIKVSSVLMNPVRIPIGGKRIVTPLIGEQLPRIC